MRNYGNTSSDPVRIHCRVRRCRSGNFQIFVYTDTGRGWKVKGLYDVETYAEADEIIRRTEELGHHPEFLDDSEPEFNTIPFPVVEFDPDIPEPVPMAGDGDRWLSRTPVSSPTWADWKVPTPDPDKSPFFVSDADPDGWWGQ